MSVSPSQQPRGASRGPSCNVLEADRASNLFTLSKCARIRSDTAFLHSDFGKESHFESRKDLSRSLRIDPHLHIITFLR